jgi:hypothetical protein
MLERLKRTLVETYVGAIALGYLLAQTILLFVNAFSSPVAAWAARRETERLLPMLRPEGAPGPVRAQGFPFENGLSSLMGFLVLLLVWYLLFRWLYFKPFRKAFPEVSPGLQPPQATNS